MTARRTEGRAGYVRAVRGELAKKAPAHAVPDDLFDEVVSRSFRSSVHPRACAGVIVIAAGLAPKKMPRHLAGLCCGQR
jgi:hypothetical protein